MSLTQLQKQYKNSAKNKAAGNCYHITVTDCHVSSSAAERNWSVYGSTGRLRLLTQKVRMQHRTADKLVYCHEMIHLQQCVQSAGWTADVERWAWESE